jgi:site-specific DNA recombinase
MQVRVATLLRLSTKRQVERQVSDEPDIPAQRQAIAAFLNTKPDWVHVREYREAGVSAFKVSAEERDVLQDALRDAAAGLWSVLIIFKADRLSRNSTEYPLVLSRLHRHGAEVWSVADAPGGRRLALESQADKLIRFMEGWQAETESVNTSIRVSARMRQLAEGGRWPGGKVPFGYQLVAVKDERGEPFIRGGRVIRRLAPHPEYAPLVREIFRRYLQGEGAGALAAWLNAAGVPTFHGRRWVPQTVRELLANPLYAGQVVYGRTASGGRQNATPVMAQGEHEALIDRETLERVRQLRAGRRRVPSGRSRAYPLTGTLRCGLCLSPMGAQARRYRLRSGAERRYYTYRCLRGRIGGCRMRSWNGQQAEQAFAAALGALSVPRLLCALVDLELDGGAGGRDTAREARRRALEQLEMIRQAVTRLDRAYLEAGLLTDEEYRAKKEQYREREQVLQAAAALPLPVSHRADRARLAALTGELAANWAVLSLEEQKRFAIHTTAAYGLSVLAGPDRFLRLAPRRSVTE